MRMRHPSVLHSLPDSQNQTALKMALSPKKWTSRKGAEKWRVPVNGRIQIKEVFSAPIMIMLPSVHFKSASMFVVIPGTDNVVAVVPHIVFISVIIPQKQCPWVSYSNTTATQSGPLVQLLRAPWRINTSDCLSKPPCMCVTAVEGVHLYMTCLHACEAV